MSLQQEDRDQIDVVCSQWRDHGVDDSVCSVRRIALEGQGMQ